MAIASLLVGLVLAPAAADAARPRKGTRAEASARTVWAGLVPGPLSPKRAREIEAALAERLSSDLGLPIVDVGGRPLGARDEELLETEHRRQYDQGIRALLAQDYERALAEFDAANELFERRLAGARDHQPRYLTLVAKASALLESGRKEAARQVLRELAALEPGEGAPNAKNQSEALVSLYESAARELGPPGLLRFEGDMSATRVRVDGRDLGKPPFGPTKLPPGRHLLSIQTNGRHRVESFTLESRSERSFRLPGEAPEGRHQKAFLEDVTFRPAQSGSGARKLIRLSGASVLLVAWAKREAGADYLYLARLDTRGEVENVTRGVLSDPPGPALRALAEVVTDARRRGGFELDPGGGAKPNARLADALGARASR